eukprot:4710842-Amphidinium_carterae.1
MICSQFRCDLTRTLTKGEQPQLGGQYLFLERDLHMTSGKLAAQVGHAVHQVMVEGKRSKLKAWDDDGGMIVVLQAA